MIWRHELKFMVRDGTLAILTPLLNGLMQRDRYQKNAAYQITSLYFDDAADSCYRDNLAGNNHRAKYRLRYYDCDTGFIRLEKKSKESGLNHKEMELLTPDLVEQMTSGRIPFPDPDMSDELQMILAEMTIRGMHPRTIVRYDRSAWTCRTGNVRITFDRNIAASRQIRDFTDPHSPMVPLTGKGINILEVKYDAFLPPLLKDTLEHMNLQETAFSKYGTSRKVLG